MADGASFETNDDIVGATDENITLDLRFALALSEQDVYAPILTDSSGKGFTLSRDELLTLPEFVLLSLFPNGLLPDSHMNSFHEGDVYPVDVSTSLITQTNGSLHPISDRAAYQRVLQALSNPDLYLSDQYYYSQYDPQSLQYMLDFFRRVALTIPTSPPSPSQEQPEPVPIEPMQGSARDMLQDRAGIIVLREDLDFYVIPPKRDIDQPEMIEVKRAAAKALLRQDGIFSGLRKSEEPGTTEQHLIEMLTAGHATSSLRFSRCSTLLTCFAAVSITTIAGATGPPSRIKRLSPPLLWHDCALTSTETTTSPTTTLSAWHRSYFSSGASRLVAAGGRASSSRTSMAWRESSRCGFGVSGLSKWYGCSPSGGFPTASSSLFASLSGR